VSRRHPAGGATPPAERRDLKRLRAASSLAHGLLKGRSRRVM